MIGCAETDCELRTRAAAAMSPNFMLVLPRWLAAADRPFRATSLWWNATSSEVCAKVAGTRRVPSANGTRSVPATLRSARLFLIRQREERSRGAGAAPKILLVLPARAGDFLGVVRHVRNLVRRR